MVNGAPEPCGGSSGRPSYQSRFAQTAPFTSSSPEPLHAAASCMATVQRFVCHLGLSRGVARQLSLCCRSSSCRLYQHQCEDYRHKCSVHGHSISTPSITNIADFHLFFACGVLSVCCSYPWIPLDPFLSFQFRLPGLQVNFIRRDLGRSFVLECPLRPISPPAWDLVLVLSFLHAPAFEPLLCQPMQVVTLKVLFLLSLATVK